MGNKFVFNNVLNKKLALSDFWRFLKIGYIFSNNVFGLVSGEKFPKSE